MKSIPPKSKQPPAPKIRKPDPRQAHQATGAEFEREGMGLAPKE
jgi:hypothetical protein